MSTLMQKIGDDRPLSPAEIATAKISRLILLAICVGPIAVFPIGLAYKAYEHFFGVQTPAAVIQTIEQPGLPR